MQRKDSKIEQLKSHKERIQDSIKQQEAARGTLNKRLNCLTINHDLSGSNTMISATEIREEAKSLISFSLIRELIND